MNSSLLKRERKRLFGNINCMHSIGFFGEGSWWAMRASRLPFHLQESCRLKGPLYPLAEDCQQVTLNKEIRDRKMRLKPQSCNSIVGGSARQHDYDYNMKR